MIALNSAKHCHLKFKFLCCRSIRSCPPPHFPVTPLQSVHCLYRSQCLGILLELLYIRVITNMPILSVVKSVFNGSSVCDIYSNSIQRGGESAQLEHSEHIGKVQTIEN